eukprot:Partr_v1_DN26814_c0_g1_i1_m40514 putative Rna binding protein
MTMSQYPSTTHSASTSPPPLKQHQQQSADEITTIFVVGFPDDFCEREFGNMFLFCPDFEGATLKYPNEDDGSSSNASITSACGNHRSNTGNYESDSNGKRKQIIGFARFQTRAAALEARNVLNGRRIDQDRNYMLKVEMAKKNLHLKQRCDDLMNPGSAGVSAYDYSSNAMPIYPQYFVNMPPLHSTTAANGLVGEQGQDEGTPTGHQKSPPISASSNDDSSNSVGERQQLHLHLDFEQMHINETGPALMSGSSSSAMLLMSPLSTCTTATTPVFHSSLPPSSSNLSFMSSSGAAVQRAFGSRQLHTQSQQPTSAVEEDDDYGMTSDIARRCLSEFLDDGRFDQHLLGTSLSNDGHSRLVTSASETTKPLISNGVFGSVNGSASGDVTPSSFHHSHHHSQQPPHSVNMQQLGSNQGFESALFHNLEHYSSAHGNHHHHQNSAPSGGNLQSHHEPHSHHHHHLGQYIQQQAQSLTRKVRPVLSDQNNPPCNTLYVGNLPLNASEDELRQMFSQCEGYKRLCYRVKANNGPMCFVEFETVPHASQAMNLMYGHPLTNSTKGGIRLSFSKNPLGVRSNAVL